MGRRKNGLGSVTQVGKNKYRLRKQVGVLDNGRPRILTVTGTSETDCYKKMKKKEEGGFLHRSSETMKQITVTDLCLMHLHEHLQQTDRLKPKAADRRESTIKNQVDLYPIGRMQAIGVTPQDVKRHIESLISENKISVSSIIKALDVINSAYRWAVNQEYLNYNPCTAVLEQLKLRLKNLDKKKSSDGIVIVLSDQQCDILKEYVDSMKENELPYRYSFGLSVLLLLYTGMRVGELCSLRWKDWRIQSGTVNINKTRNITKIRDDSGSGYKPNENEVKNYHARTICLTDEAQAVLLEMKRIAHKSEPDDYILLNQKENPSNPSNYDRNIKVLYSKIGFDSNITEAHVLRRTCATQMHNRGCLVEDIAAYLGDTPETIIKHYISLTKQLVADGEVLNVVQVPSSKK